MSQPTVVLITGVARGIGKAVLQTYLKRPDHIVIGSVRDTKSAAAQALQKLPTASGTRLFTVKIESTSASDPAAAVQELKKTAGIDRIDIVIANAGYLRFPPAPLDSVTAQEVTEAFQINTLGPLVLFQAVLPLLKKSAAPKWISVSSVIGSTGTVPYSHGETVPAYGIAKAGLNWMTMAAHCAVPHLIVFAIHPGLVQSESGNASARMMGMEQAPVTLEQSATAIHDHVVGATRETTSGKFIDVITGKEVQW